MFKIINLGAFYFLEMRQRTCYKAYFGAAIEYSEWGFYLLTLLEILCYSELEIWEILPDPIGNGRKVTCLENFADFK